MYQIVENRIFQTEKGQSGVSREEVRQKLQPFKQRNEYLGLLPVIDRPGIKAEVIICDAQDFLPRLYGTPESRWEDRFLQLLRLGYTINCESDRTVLFATRLVHHKVAEWVGIGTTVKLSTPPDKGVITV